MKLLFDQNISFRILNVLPESYFESRQVKSLNLTDKSDLEIWNYGKINDFTIVTFDADFADLANLKGHPPKILWLRMGNTTTKGIVDILRNKEKEIKEFIYNKEFEHVSCLELS